MKTRWKLESGTIKRLNAHPKAIIYYNPETHEAWSRIEQVIYPDPAIKVVQRHCGIAKYNTANIFNLINYDIERQNQL